MEKNAEAKSMRALAIYSRLCGGAVLRRAALAEEYGVSERSIQRDMDTLRTFIAEEGLSQEITFDRRLDGYRLVDSASEGLTNSEILAVCKILLESRSMRRDEMMPILDKLLALTVPSQSRKAVAELIANEKRHYIEPHHQRPILSGLWELGQAIQKQLVTEIEYVRLKEPGTVRRRIEPVGLLFSEYYFYLAAYIEDMDRAEHFENPGDRFPTIYRIDRIRGFNVTQEHFRIPYRDRFEEGEFRKRVQFMYGGKLQTVRFKYTGPSLEAVLDRLPTAKILSEDGSGWTVEAEVFGKGINMWLNCQGEYVKILP